MVTGSRGAQASFSRQGASFSHRGSSYLVETRARVIVFDVAAFEADSALIRGTSSFMSHAVDHPHKSLSREHSGLMSWPEHFFKPKQQKQIPEEIDGQADSLSARAMQLSRYGSMVCSVNLCFSAVHIFVGL